MLNETIVSLMPFANKIALLLSDVIEPHVGFRIYYHHPHSFYEDSITLIVMFISLLGINLNVINATLDGGYKLGIIISIIYFLISYLIPNFFFDDLYRAFDFLGVNSNKLIGLIFGIVVVVILDILIIKLKEKYKKRVKKDGNLFNSSWDMANTILKWVVFFGFFLSLHNFLLGGSTIWGKYPKHSWFWGSLMVLTGLNTVREFYNDFSQDILNTGLNSKNKEVAN